MLMENYRGFKLERVRPVWT